MPTKNENVICDGATKTVDIYISQGPTDRTGNAACFRAHVGGYAEMIEQLN